MGEPRLQEAVSGHRAWLAVEFVESDRWQMEGRVYQLIGKLVAELCDRDCLAVVCPGTGGISIHTEEVRDELRGNDPMQLVSHFIQPPVLKLQSGMLHLAHPLRMLPKKR